MKKVTHQKKTTKQLLREQLNKDIQTYLDNGGTISELSKIDTSWDEDNVKFMHKVMRMPNN